MSEPEQDSWLPEAVAEVLAAAGCWLVKLCTHQGGFSPNHGWQRGRGVVGDWQRGRGVVGDWWRCC